MTFIVSVYHKKIHSSIGRSPLSKYKEGLLGGEDFSGHGLPAKISDEEKLTLDFMPFFERSVQRYGVKIDKISYYHDILRRWINAKNPGSKTEKRKFVFRRDPRDITVIYFLDPEVKKCYPIPCGDISRPAISIWECRDSIKTLVQSGLKTIDEEAIFSAYEKLQRLKENSSRKTMSIKRKRHTKEGRKNIHNRISTDNYFSDMDLPSGAKIVPYEDIDHGSS